MQTDDAKEATRLRVLEEKARLYDELQKRVNLEDEAANDLHEVDFIAKVLQSGVQETSQLPSSAPLLAFVDLGDASEASKPPLRMP